MSVTIEKIMTLPSLRRARVLAGKSCMDRIISSISVLEYSDTTKTQQELFDHIEFFGSELIITSFASIVNDVDAQCENIRRFASVGETGMILYYVGLLLPKVDQRLIDLADELGFVLICMPENDPSLRYSDVICEVMDMVTLDRLNNPTLALDLLDQMSRLPTHQRTIDTMLRIVSDRLRATALITDTKGQVLSAVGWPRDMKASWMDWMKQLPAWLTDDEPMEIKCEYPLWVYQKRFETEIHLNMRFLVFSEGRQLEPTLWKQAVEGIRLAMNLWGREHDRIGLLELVRAIIQDEPIKMRRLADIYKIDVAALSDMWIVHSEGKADLSSWLEEIRELSGQYANVSICELYEGDILIFPVGTASLQEADAWACALLQACEKARLSVVLTRCAGLQNTAVVKDAYLANRSFVGDAQVIFPTRRFFTLPEIMFAKHCRSINEAGEKRIQPYLALLRTVSAGRDGEDILRSLAVFLLDEHTSVTDTAARLFVHKNTIKYRLQKTSNLLGFRVGEMPGSQELICALALWRLLRGTGTGEI